MSAGHGPARTPLRDAATALSTPPDSFFTVHQGDARRLEMLLCRYSSARKPLLTTTITSPPYGALKNYGHADQIGFGQRHDEYLLDMRRVFRSLYVNTKRNGSLWVVADTVRQRRAEGQIWPMQLLPFELAREAEGEKWLLREIIVWLKDKTLPWSSRGRMRNAFEYVLLFVKSDKFKYKVERLREPSDLEQWWVRYPERYNPQGKAPTNVWPVPIPVQGSWANTTIQHACPLPADLIERMLLISTDPGDVALDPFAGSGVVVAEAQRLQRRGVGLELVDAHIDAFQKTVLPEITKRRGPDLVQDLHNRSEDLRQTILKLRAVKYPKLLVVAVRQIAPDLPRPHAVYAFRHGGSTTHIAVDIVLVLPDSDMPRAEDWLHALDRATRRRPVSKFGVKPRLRVVAKSTQTELHRGRRLWAYVGGRTHSASGRCTSANASAWAAEPSRHDLPLVVSNVYVNESPRRLRVADPTDEQ
jgi:DNA modification methylase